MRPSQPSPRSVASQDASNGESGVLPPSTSQDAFEGGSDYNLPPSASQDASEGDGDYKWSPSLMEKFGLESKQEPFDKEPMHPKERGHLLVGVPDIESLQDLKTGSLQGFTQGISLKESASA